ncbi:hypothetical protein [uncultured Megasphaera sp.]|jgi:hypothetical protein|uniref:hypothetical protein n=1 Tax=uncultured Megasphaera sp. TaxID=165188 RepID=UPI002051E571|nr:hypothetical protein [uncultured Megasphaera sp.]DAK32663.1 MAG TPA: hypothetical protein [Caudoviricetes sp.]
MYVSVYEKEKGIRITSYALKVHGKSIDDLIQIARETYPKDIIQVESKEEWRNSVKNGLVFSDGEYKQPQIPNLEEIKLQRLDAEYKKKFKKVDDDLVKAVALGDEETKKELLEERTSLKTEYIKKRGEL